MMHGPIRIRYRKLDLEMFVDRIIRGIIGIKNGRGELWGGGQSAVINRVSKAAVYGLRRSILQGVNLF